MDGEVTLAHITEAHTARISAQEKYERDLETEERTEFLMIGNSVRPQFYDLDLERIRQRCSVEAGHWLHDDEQFKVWRDSDNPSKNVLWLCGIPGAGMLISLHHVYHANEHRLGKTFLSSIIVSGLQSRSAQLCVAFAFLSHQSAKDNITLVVLHSFLFQLVSGNKDLRPTLAYHHEHSHRKFLSSNDFIRDLIKDILKTLPTTFFIVDGIDEVVENERLILLASLQGLQKVAPNLKLMISSRAEYDIGASLGSRCCKKVVHQFNEQDILAYVRARTEKWLAGMTLPPEIASSIREVTKDIASRSGGESHQASLGRNRTYFDLFLGMFLYARLVCDNLERLSDPEDVETEVQNLPNGLKEA